MVLVKPQSAAVVSQYIGVPTLPRATAVLVLAGEYPFNANPHRATTENHGPSDILLAMIAENDYHKPQADFKL